MKTVLITGASGGLGTSLINELHNEGYRIIATVGSPKNQDLFRHLTNVDSYVVDLLNPENVATFLNQIRHESLQAAALLVSGFTAGGFDDTDADALESMYKINFLTAFNVVKPLLKIFDAQGGGQFILIGARPALEATTGKHLVAYSLSKALIFELANLINAYGTEKHISATMIVPGTIDTPANRQAMPDADPAEWVTPEAISKSIIFLLSDAGRSISEPVLKLYR